MTGGFKHGASAYANGKCRCGICKAAASKRKVERDIRMQGKPVPDGSHGKTGWITYGCRCDVCRAGIQAANRETQIRERVATQDQARNWGKQWTGPELEIALREDLTAVQAALMLGRTARAVRSQRSLRKDPRKDRLAGVSKKDELKGES